MTKILTLLTILLTIYLTNCSNTKTENKIQVQNLNDNLIDTNIITVLTFEKTKFKFFKENKITGLTIDELFKIEKILKKCIQNYNIVQEKTFNELIKTHPKYKLDKKNFTIDLKKFKRQYVAVLNSKGEKEVWLNCFCDPGNQNWKRKLLRVKVGGNCYFNVKINLTTGFYYELMANGDI